MNCLRWTYSLRKEGSCEFSLPTYVKNSRPGHPARTFLFLAFPENPKICVIPCLTTYVERTKGLRKSTQLLMSFISPHKAISSQSVSRWLSRALRMAGIELNYTGHSTRGASTSAAAAAGLSADLILEAVDWASVQTFERFYHRVICWCLCKSCTVTVRFIISRNTSVLYSYRRLCIVVGHYVSL